VFKTDGEWTGRPEMIIQGVIAPATLIVSKGFEPGTCLARQDYTPEKTDLFLIKHNNIKAQQQLHTVVKT
jgi:hypothetical protein